MKKENLPTADDLDLIVCFDPSLTTCGCAIINARDHSRQKHKTGKLLEVVDWFVKETKGSRYVVILENPNLDKNTFGQLGLVISKVEQYVKRRVWLVSKRGKPTQSVSQSDVSSQISIALNVAQKVGKSKASALILCQLLDRAGIPYAEVKPSDRMRVDKDKNKILFQNNPRLLVMPTKTNADQYAQIFGFTGRSSEHSRDAGCLIAFRTNKAIRIMIKRSIAEKGNDRYSLFKNQKQLIDESTI